jgi:parallel beta-helix repeat protein
MMRGGTSANVVKENTFDGNRVGVLLFGPVGTTLKENILSFSGLAAIRVNVSATGNVLRENTILSNPAGIDFIVTPTGSAIGNELRENTITLNTCGLKGPVAGNTLTENIFQGNAVDSCP